MQLRYAGTRDDQMALEGDGLRVLVSRAMWDDLRARAPVMSDADDQRDFALGEVERLVAERSQAPGLVVEPLG